MAAEWINMMIWTLHTRYLYFFQAWNIWKCFSVTSGTTFERVLKGGETHCKSLPTADDVLCTISINPLFVCVTNNWVTWSTANTTHYEWKTVTKKSFYQPFLTRICISYVPTKYVVSWPKHVTQNISLIIL